MQIPAEIRALSAKIEALFGRVVIWPCDVQFTDRSSLLIRPDTSEDAPETGIVVSAAADCEAVKTGDVVLFGRYSGYGISDSMLITCREEDVFLRLNGMTVKPRRGDSSPLAGSIIGSG